VPKINRKYLIIAFLLLILFVSSCKSECKVSPDCDSKKCMSVSCVEKKCQYSIVKNCCGNGIEEKLENGKQGDKCTCPGDYGNCEGKGQLTIRNRQYDAAYLKYFCNTREKCVFGVDAKDVIESKLVDERDLSFFILETQTTFNKPFNVLEDTFKFQVKLKDAGEDLVLPVKITNVQLKENEILFGEETLDKTLNSVGRVINTEIGVEYRPTQIEEEHSLSYKLDYQYTKKVKTSRKDNGTWDYKEEVVRDSYEKRFSSRIFFVNPGEQS